MDKLTKNEEIFLIAIWRLEDRAYGYLIRRHILREFRQEFSIGHIYSVLNQMDRKGYVSKYEGGSSESRRGKPKIYYRLTREGIMALKAARRAHDLIWNGISMRALEEGEK